jgi:hypothetical protein
MIATTLLARRVTWTYGAPPLGIDDERLVTGWASILTALVEGFARSLPPQPTGSASPRTASRTKRKRSAPERR